ncbi:hypothetical protein D9758_016771, partial [Tetrapyrgos nigripes]
MSSRPYNLNQYGPVNPGGSKQKTARSVSSSYEPVPTNVERYARSRTTAEPITQKSSLIPNPNDWRYNVSPHVAEADDAIHNIDPENDTKTSRTRIFSGRGYANYGCLLIVVL